MKLGIENNRLQFRPFKMIDEMITKLRDLFKGSNSKIGWSYEVCYAEISSRISFV